jgi:phospholipid/cholesterol/gamma-HCH transport system substrate-binding protein
MRRALAIGALAAAVIVAVVFASGAGGDNGGDYKVRAIFDNASFLIPGQDVKIAGAKVGVVDDLDIQSQPDGNYKAAIVMQIEKDGFKDFRQDAHCAIRLQSVIGEKLIECTPTQPRAPGAAAPPELEEIPEGEPGAGQRLLPVENTETPVDADLINNIQRKPFRVRFSILLNELGAGLASRAEDIQVLIRRANPALREFDQFLKILAGQNKMLEKLTKDADTVLTAWARKSKETANFFVQSRIAARATAEERIDFERNFQKFPAFMRQLRPFMQRFGALSEAMAPVISDLRASAPDLSRFLIALGPFSRSSNAALKTLGQTADIGRPILVNAKPVAERIAEFTSRGRKVVRNLSRLFTSIDQHKGIERLMDTLFYITMSTNGFDELGHYLRNALIVTACAAYATTHSVACTANFDRPEITTSAFASSTRPVSWTVRQLIKALGLDQKKDEAEKSQRADKSGSDPAPASKPEPAPASGNSGDSPGGGDAAPQADSPAAGNPDQGQAPQSRDPLLNYLLGDEQ